MKGGGVGKREEREGGRAEEDQSDIKSFLSLLLPLPPPASCFPAFSIQEHTMISG